MDGIPHRVASRIVDGLPTVGRVLVRDRCGRPDVVELVAAEFERRSVEVVVQHRSDRDLARLLSGTTPAHWSYDRLVADGEFPEVDATVSLGGWSFDATGAGLHADVVSAWGASIGQGIQAMDERGMVTLAVAVPSDGAAAGIGMTIDDLDAAVFPAVLADVDEIRDRCVVTAEAVESSTSMTIRTQGCRLDLDRGARLVHRDDGIIDTDDRATGAVVSNLPAGSVYWTVEEDASTGSVRVGDGSTLTFGSDGRVVSGEFAGERVSHIGIGLNPNVSQPVGWTIIDEHAAGRLFIALGENRYMGGQNASSINFDLLVAGAANFEVCGVPVVNGGRLVT